MNEKTQLRKTCLARRDALSQSDIRDKSRAIHERLSAIAEFRNAKQFLCYVSKDNEVDTLTLIGSLLTEGRSVLVPIVEQDGTLQWSRLESLDELEPGAFGVPEPRAECRRLVNAAHDALVIVPCVAFDSSGHRLGYGKGYFDRFLERHRGRTVGLAFETQKIEHLPVEEHDVPLDIVLTESGCYSKG